MADQLSRIHVTPNIYYYSNLCSHMAKPLCWHLTPFLVSSISLTLLYTTMKIYVSSGSTRFFKKLYATTYTLHNNQSGPTHHDNGRLTCQKLKIMQQLQPGELNFGIITLQYREGSTSRNHSKCRLAIEHTRNQVHDYELSFALLLFPLRMYATPLWSF